MSAGDSAGAWRLIGDAAGMNSADLERQCDRYARVKLWLAALEYVVLLGVLAGLTITGIAGGWVHTLTLQLRSPLQVFFVYLVMLAATTRLAVLPVQFASGHLVEHRFGLSRQTGLQWLAEWAATSLLVGLPLLLLLTPIVMHLRW